MRIRIKIKHLAALLLVCGIAAAGAAVWASSAVSRAERQSADSVMEQLLAETPLAHRFDIYVGPNGTMGGGAVYGAETPGWPEKQPLLEHYVRHAANELQIVAAAVQLSDYYAVDGRMEEASEALRLAEERLNGTAGPDRLNELALQRARLEAASGRTREAERLLREADGRPGTTNLDLAGRLGQTQALLLAAGGRLDEALEAVVRAAGQYESALEAAKPGASGDSRTGYVKLDQLHALRVRLEDAVKRGDSGRAAVSGTVTRANGQPMAYAGVFLRAREDVNHSVAENEPYQTMTDASGRFSFRGVLPDSYQLFLGLDLDQIDGWTWPVAYEDWIDIEDGASVTRDIVLQPLIDVVEPVNSVTLAAKHVTFRWQPVEGAVTYKLSATVPISGASLSPIIRDGIREPYANIPVDELYMAASGILFGDPINDWEKIEPLSLLGLAYPDSRYSWGVEAFDGDGKLLTRSSGYRLNPDTMLPLPTFYLKERELTAEDRLLLEGRLEEALTGYKTAYAGNPKDLHSLHMTIRLLQAKASASRDERYEDDAAEYLAREVELKPTQNNLFALAHYYFERRNWAAYNEAYGRSIAAAGRQPNEYEQSVHATALMLQGKLEEAADRFAKAMALDPSHRFVGSYLALILNRNESFDEALSLAERYPDRMYGAPDWRALLQELQEETGGGKSAVRIDNATREKLALYVKGAHEPLEQWLDAGDDRPALRALVKAMLAVG